MENSEGNSTEEGGDWIGEAAAAIRLESLPPKSAAVYLKAYDQFIEWKTSKKLSKIDENLLLVYFDEMRKKYAPTSLWSKWSMLRTVIQNKHGIDMAAFGSVKNLLKRHNQGHEKKKSKVFREEDVKKFLSDAPDRIYLAHKVVMILGLSGACRRCEMYNLTTKDFEENPNSVIGKIRDGKFESSRTFVIEPPFLEIYKKYAKLRPANTTRSNFLVKYQAGKCHNQVVGKEKIGKMPKEIAEFLKLQNPEKYTGHSFRRTSTTIFSDAGASVFELQQLGGWKSEPVAKSYVNETLGNKVRMNRMLQNQIALPRCETLQCPMITQPRQPPTATITRPPSPVLVETPDFNTEPPQPIVQNSASSTSLPIQLPVAVPHAPIPSGSTVSTFTHRQVTSEIHREVGAPLQPININLSNCNNCNVSFNFPKIP